MERIVLSKSAWLQQLRESKELHDRETDAEASWLLYLNAAQEWCDRNRSGMYEVIQSETSPEDEYRNTVDHFGATRYAQDVVRANGRKKSR
jgi:hypothetical protein